MGKKERAATSSLNLWLRKKVLERRDESDDDSSPVDSLELYQEFMMSGLDVKGQISTGLASAQKSAGVSGTFSFELVPLPAGLSPLTASLKATTSGATGNYSLFALQRQPSSIELGSRHKYKTETPISLLKLTGKARDFSLEGSATATVGFAPKKTSLIGPEEFTLSLNLSAEAIAKAEYKGTYLKLKYDYIGYFPSPLEKRLLQNFHQLTGGIDKAELKREANEWLLKDENKSYKFKVSTKADSTKALIEIFEQLRKDTVFYKKHIFAINNFLAKLNYLAYGDSFESIPSNPIMSNYCTLSLWGHKGTGEATVKGSAKASVQSGITLKSLGASAEASAGISGNIKYTTYRFQTVCGVDNETKANVVITQDTIIEYRQVKLSASVSATATYGYEEEKAQKSAEKNIYNMMLYRSACVYWFSNSRQETLPGSGLCFGMSVLAKRLIDLAKSVAQAKQETSQENLMNALCKQLRVQESDMKEFLKSSYFADASVEDFPTAVVLLESSLIPPSKYQIPLEPEQKNGPAKKLLQDMKDKNKSTPFTLEAIRVRYRIADLDENKKTLFKLGLKPPVVKLEVNLAKVTQAGREGIIDLYTHWFSPELKQFNQEKLDRREAYEKATPPVALLHQ